MRKMTRKNRRKATCGLATQPRSRPRSEKGCCLVATKWHLNAFQVRPTDSYTSRITISIMRQVNSLSTTWTTLYFAPGEAASIIIFTLKIKPGHCSILQK
jgi:hypothetical protein